MERLTKAELIELIKEKDAQIAKLKSGLYEAYGTALDLLKEKNDRLSRLELEIDPGKNDYAKGC